VFVEMFASLREHSHPIIRDVLTRFLALWETPRELDP
jgi:hypothetical protein